MVLSIIINTIHIIVVVVRGVVAFIIVAVIAIAADALHEELPIGIVLPHHVGYSPHSLVGFVQTYHAQRHLRRTRVRHVQWSNYPHSPPHATECTHCNLPHWHYTVTLVTNTEAERHYWYVQWQRYFAMWPRVVTASTFVLAFRVVWLVHQGLIIYWGHACLTLTPIVDLWEKNNCSRSCC